MVGNEASAREKPLGVPEVAKELNYSEKSIREMLNRGDIKGTRIRPGGKWLITREGLDNYKLEHGLIQRTIAEQPQLDLEQKLKPQAYLETQETRIHDKGIFENSDGILSETDFKEAFILLSYNSILRSYQYRLFKFLKYFKGESNKYADWHLNYVSTEMCNALERIVAYLEADAAEREIILSMYEENFEGKDPFRPNFQGKAVRNTYSSVMKKLLDDTSNINIPESDELYLIIDPRTDMLLEVPELSDSFNVQIYTEYQKQFNELVNNARNAYKTYRVAVRETLFL